MKKKYLLFLPTLFMVLAGCNGTASKGKKDDEDYTYQETRDMMEEALDEIPIEVVDYEGDLTPLPIKETVDCPETQSLVKFKEGDVDQFVYVTKIEDVEAPIVNDYTPQTGDVILKDENDNPVECNFVSYDGGVAKYRVPVSKFSEDHFYHCEIKNNGLKFLKKDPSIRDLTYYSLDINDQNRVRSYSYNSDSQWAQYDLSMIQYFDADALGAYFISNEPIDLEVDQMMRIADQSVPEDNKDTTYGRFQSCGKNPNGSGYVVRYNPCRGADVYSNININDKITVNEDNVSNFESFTDDETIEQQLARNFLHNDQTVAAMLGLMNHYDVSPRNFKRSAIDWASKVNVSFDLHFDGDTFTWGATLTLNLNPEDYLSIQIELGYKSTTKYDVSASISIETEFFIPVGVNYKLEVKEDDTKEISFKIVLSSQVHPYDKDAIEEGIENDLTDALKNDTAFKSKFKGDSATATTNGTSYPLIRFDLMYFFPLDIRFEIDFYWEVQLTFETDIVYTSHTTRTDVSVSNKKGCDPSSESQAENDKEIKLYFMGSFHAEVGLRVSFGLGISGFYKFFHAEVFIKAYGAVDAMGFLLLDISWGDHGSSAMGTMGGKFEITAGVKWGVDIQLLFGGVTLDWPVKVWTLVGFASDSSVSRFTTTEGEVVGISSDDTEAHPEINLDDFHLLNIEAFDAQEFGTKFLEIKHDDGVTTQYGEWINDKDEKYVQSIEMIGEHSDRVTLNDFKVTGVDWSDIEEFDVQVKVTLNPAILVSDPGVEEVSKTFTIHFVNKMVQEILLDDQGTITSYGSYVFGHTISLPVPLPPPYKKFTGWNKVVDSNPEHPVKVFMPYDPNDPHCGDYTIPEDPAPQITFEMVYEDHYYWDIVWVDGLGNIVQIDHVYCDDPTGIVEIDPSVRDRWMVSNDPEYEYVFTGYDVDISVPPTENMVIHAQYEYRKVSA